MTTQVIGGDNRWNLLQTLTESEGDRSDIAALLNYRDGFDPVSPVYLFWELYRPSFLYNDGSRAPAPPLSIRSKSVILELLHEMHDRHRSRYQPDQMDSDIRDYLEVGNEHEFRDSGFAFPDKLKDLLVLIHVAAARAFVLKEDSGFSEEVVACLYEVERAWQWLSFSGYPGSSSGSEVDSYEVFHSIDAISALALVELARIEREQGHYAEALPMMASAEERYKNACILVMGPRDLWPLGDELSQPNAQSRLHEYLTGMHLPVRYVLETFDMLKAQRPDVAWSQVAADCGGLAGAHFLCFPSGPELTDVEESEGDEDRWEVSEEYLFPEEAEWPGGFPAGDYWGISEEQMEHYTLLDEQSNTVTWFGFWQIAQGWASAQLSPGAYMKMRENDMKKEAENRLRSYFFRGIWTSLPVRARDRLVQADKTWNSREYVSGETILSDLLTATEELCERFLYLQVKNEESVQAEVRELEDRVARRGYSSLGVNEHISICNIRGLPTSLKMLGLTESEIKFITRELPSSMTRLKGGRNQAEHNVGSSVPREKVNQEFRRFLGIGERGMLRELARIGAKLERKRKSSLRH